VSVAFNAGGLTALLKGEIFDESRHVIEMEMKAVTYHGFSLVEEEGMYKATIVIDV
jgi:SHS2 domain-containing protein